VGLAAIPYPIVLNVGLATIPDLIVLDMGLCEERHNKISS
jgi:hypothetical protein